MGISQGQKYIIDHSFCLFFFPSPKFWLFIYWSAKNLWKNGSYSWLHERNSWSVSFLKLPEMSSRQSQRITCAHKQAGIASVGTGPLFWVQRMGIRRDSEGSGASGFCPSRNITKGPCGNLSGLIYEANVASPGKVSLFLKMKLLYSELHWQCCSF